MTLKKLLIILAVLGLGLAACAPAAPGQEFKSDSGKFSVVVPVALTEQVQAVDTPTGGKRDAHIFSADAGKLAYIISYTDYAADTDMGDAAAFLDSIRKTAVATSNGGIQSSQSNISLDGNPGMEFTFNFKGPNNEPFLTRAHVFLAGRRLYQVMAVANQGQATTGDMDAFLNTFKILK
jgi:hypothetical protein